jgi:hypothetical protein
MAARVNRRSYARRNDSLAADLEDDAVLIGLTVAVVGVLGYLLYQKASSSGAAALSSLHDEFNQAMGGEVPMGSDVAPGSPEEPENYVGYE